MKNYKVWQDGNKLILLQTNEMMEQRLLYVHQNPEEAEIVDEPEHYWYSSARDYAGQKGLLDVTCCKGGHALQTRARVSQCFFLICFKRSAIKC